jgi:predicted ATPase/class 3 adenylate cyclase/DNA-binding CsgD family transcriptional regulator
MGDVSGRALIDDRVVTVRPLPASWLDEPMSSGFSPDQPGFSLPVGTVTFLLTDVEGSTQGWEAKPAPMGAAIARHYELLDAAIAGRGGVRPVEQGEGDSVVGAFARASDAIAAALDAQRAFAAEVWPDGIELAVRMAVHTGEAELRDEGNYFGPAVIRCARLRAIGHGGQVLVSDVAAGLVAERMPDDAELVELGVHRLRDLGRPERVWELRHPDLPTGFAPLRSLDSFRHNLPVQLTPLIGRGTEVAEVSCLVIDERAVTLTGSGGVGKTRLALAVAADAVERFAGGAWLVELAGVGDPGGVASTTLAAIGGRQAPGGDLVQQVAAELGPRESLLVLDNCEHLLDGCAEMVVGLLAANSAVTVLATSREPLGVPGEVSWRVPSLPAPPPGIPVAVAALSQFDAVRLFIDRARRARPSFKIDDANAPAVAQICSRLDGIPLALELAAARCRQLSAERIARDLDDRFTLLTGGARTVLHRHQTLMASIDWSFNRLDTEEAIAFRRLGVFADAFPLEAAEAVLAALQDLDPVAVFDLLSRLVDKSLVAVEDGPGGEPRYLLLETLRAYALDRLRDVGELEAMRRAHAEWCLGWLEALRGQLHLDAVVERVEFLYGNLKAALDWSVDHPGIGVRLLDLLARAWQAGGRPTDAIAAVDRLLNDDDNVRRAGRDGVAALNWAGLLVAGVRTFDDGLVLFQQAERLAIELGDEYGAAVARWLMGFNAEDCRMVHDLARARGDDHTYAITFINLVEIEIEDDPRAVAQLESDEVVAMSRASSLFRDDVIHAKAWAERGTGDLRRCVDLMIELSRSRDALLVVGAVNILSASALLSGDDEALAAAADTAERKLISRSITADNIVEWPRHRLGLRRGEPSRVEPALRDHADACSAATLHLIAREAIDAGDPTVAVEATQAQVERGAQNQAVAAAVLAAATTGEDEWQNALQLAADHGLRLLVVDALEGLASTASRAESWRECLRLYGAAARLRDECTYRWRFGFEQRMIDEAVAAARAELDHGDADTAEAEGRALPWPEAVHYARRARGERKRPRHGWPSLTPSEQQVVALVAEGLTNPEIAERLFMGRETVKTHLSRIYDKLGVRSRAALATEFARRPRAAADPT